MLRAVVFFVGAGLLAQTQYDLVLKGGHVIDPKNGIDAVRDVAIKDGKIAAIGGGLEGKRVADVSGLFVVPGLVDIHVHVFPGVGGPAAAYASGENGVWPDDHGPRACTTTMVDAGSSGWANYDDFDKRIVKRSTTRILAFLNIVGQGMGGGKVEQNTADMEPKKVADAILAHRDVLVGVKTAHYTAPDWIAVDRAVEAGTMAKVPVMVDFGSFKPQRPYEELVLKHLRPGDISTHVYLRSVPLLEADGKLKPYLAEARKRGVIFDVGHGGGSFVWRQAEPATRQGFFPDSISTDLHIHSMNAGMKDMVNVMSKFLNLNMPRADIVKASTWTPAKIIGREELGHLTVGAGADVAVLRYEVGSYGFLDVENKSMRGVQRFSCEMTVRDGKVVWDLNGRAGDPALP
jgi:dihydroorotase